MFGLLFLLPASAPLVTPASAEPIEWVLVGAPGNAADLPHPFCGPATSDPCGAVPAPYRISKYEVTNSQYAAMLNAVDPNGTNALLLYNPNMGSDPANGGIVNTGPAGSVYQVKPGFAEKPVTYVSFFDAIRFANWLQNVNDGKGGSITETGSYTLLGGTPTPSNGTIVTRNPSAKFVLPSENEWYKAAYYDPATQAYFDYPTGTNTETSCGDPPGSSNSANCIPSPSGPSPGAVSQVGAYAGSASPNGTFDQGGNVTEWNEQIRSTTARGLRGGAWSGGAGLLTSGVSDGNDPALEFADVGFRVAAYAQCDDLIDNDGDGFIDHPVDPGCDSATALDENPSCQNGLDDDGDGTIDFDGGAAANGGIALAAPDSNCSSPQAREGGLGCGFGFELALVVPPLLWLRLRRRHACA